MGVPPTPLNARTGEFTPPGITCWAREKSAVEFFIIFPFDLVWYRIWFIVLQNEINFCNFYENNVSTEYLVVCLTKIVSRKTFDGILRYKLNYVVA